MTTKKTAPTRGKPVNCYMRDEDVSLIRDLATFISGQGYRVSDSQVIKAALRVAKPDSKLLKAFEEVLQMDGRFKREE
ncbi:MAG TPA: hypothetical protein VGU67_00010 [Edaphobacter sp.]|nr:hypothetical protein [Edaphobacter sp.]